MIDRTLSLTVLQFYVFHLFYVLSKNKFKWIKKETTRKGILDPRGGAAVVFSSLKADSGTELGTSLPSLLHELGGRGAGDTSKVIWRVFVQTSKSSPNMQRTVDCAK